MAAELHSHLEKAAGHGDVLKHVILMSHIQEQQKAHPEGILFVDTHCGPYVKHRRGRVTTSHKVRFLFSPESNFQWINRGLYDLSLQKSQEFEKGIVRISQALDDAPPIVKEYFEVVQETDEFMQNYPGSPIFVEKLMRPQDEYRLCDLFVGDVQGLKQEPMLEQGDSYHEEAVNYFMPETDKHPVIFIDPSFTTDEDFYKTRELMDRILAKNPYATVIIFYPLVENNKYRYTFTKLLKDNAKKNGKIGYYHAYIIVQRKGTQGGSIFIANPTKQFDDVCDEELLDYLSAILLKVGRSEYALDQWMKKPKKKGVKPPEPPKDDGAPKFAF